MHYNVEIGFFRLGSLGVLLFLSRKLKFIIILYDKMIIIGCFRIFFVKN